MTTRDLGKLWLLLAAGVTYDKFMVQTEIAAKARSAGFIAGRPYGTRRRQKKLRSVRKASGWRPIDWPGSPPWCTPMGDPGGSPLMPTLLWTATRPVGTPTGTTSTKEA